MNHHHLLQALFPELPFLPPPSPPKKLLPRQPPAGPPPPPLFFFVGSDGLSWSQDDPATAPSDAWCSRRCVSLSDPTSGRWTSGRNFHSTFSLELLRVHPSLRLEECSKGITWLYPPPSKNHHQGYYILTKDSRTKPSFVTGIRLLRG